MDATLWLVPAVGLPSILVILGLWRAYAERGWGRMLWLAAAGLGLAELGLIGRWFADLCYESGEECGYEVVLLVGWVLCLALLTAAAAVAAARRFR